jgi:hypothetical protein
MNIQDMTPSQIDTLLAPIYAEYSNAKAGKGAALNSIDNYRGYGATRYASTITRLEARAAECQAAMDVALAKMAPYEAEYKRRGGWTRFFMVMNNGGHLHSSRQCSTCRWSTQFAWMPEYSGSVEAEIVDLAGEDACSVCFPSAPVEQKSMLPFRVKEREEIEKLAAEKAEKLAAKLAKAINADGSEWKVRELGMHENFKTIRSVELAIHRELDNKHWYGNMEHRTEAENAANRAQYDELALFLAKKLAERTGRDAEAIVADIQAKVNKKNKVKA